MRADYGAWAWLKWLLWDSRRRCAHVPGPWQMAELGIGKVRYCSRCGKCLEVV